ncbi:MAG: hypothetical protein ACRC2B_18925, partial [Rubrivivax sp.]
ERGEFRAVPVNEATHTLIAPILFLALHKHSIGACAVMGPDMNPTTLIDAQLDLVLHGLERRTPHQPHELLPTHTPSAAATSRALRRVRA